jgi:hypothetical protein
LGRPWGRPGRSGSGSSGSGSGSEVKAETKEWSGGTGRRPLQYSKIGKQGPQKGTQTKQKTPHVLTRKRAVCKCKQISRGAFRARRQATARLEALIGAPVFQFVRLFSNKQPFLFDQDIKNTTQQHGKQGTLNNTGK